MADINLGHHYRHVGFGFYSVEPVGNKPSPYHVSGYNVPTPFGSLDFQVCLIPRRNSDIYFTHPNHDAVYPLERVMGIAGCILSEPVNTVSVDHDDIFLLLQQVVALGLRGTVYPPVINEDKNEGLINRIIEDIHNYRSIFLMSNGKYEA